MHKHKKKHVDVSGQVQYMCKMHSWKSRDVWAFDVLQLAALFG